MINRIANVFIFHISASRVAQYSQPTFKKDHDDEDGNNGKKQEDKIGKGHYTEDNKEASKKALEKQKKRLQAIVGYAGSNVPNTNMNPIAGHGQNQNNLSFNSGGDKSTLDQSKIIEKK